MRGKTGPVPRAPKKPDTRKHAPGLAISMRTRSNGTVSLNLKLDLNLNLNLKLDITIFRDSSKVLLKKMTIINLSQFATATTL